MSDSTITCTTWNVNSVRARLPVILEWLDENDVDVLALQEIKCEDGAFPYPFFQEKGYQCAVYGQKSYNGVAILSKIGLEDINTGLEGWDIPQSRYIDALVGGRLRIASVYVPNGQDIDTPAYQDKLMFMNVLHSRIQTILSHDEPFAIGGDWNIVPRNEDKHPDWNHEIFCSAKERNAFKSILNLGLDDVGSTQQDNAYTWWDYRALAFRRNFGLRIDHWLTSKEVINTYYKVDKSARAKKKTSDHAPVTVKLHIQ